MTAYTRGVGTTFERSIDGGTVFTAVANVMSVTPPPRTRQVLDVSALDDVEDAKASGNKGAGQLRATLRFSAAEVTQDDLFGDFDTAANLDYQVVFADATEQPFEGFITEWNPQAVNRDGDVQVEVAIEVDGALPFPV